MIILEKVRIDLPGFSLQDIDLSIKKGESFALLGPTGAGKTLLLEAIAGLMALKTGRVVVDGKDLTPLPPEKRNIGIVYQDSALFPHLNVIKNITYGLRYRKHDQAAIQENLEKILHQLNLNHLVDRSIQHLSGGEKQRVALARALTVNPSVLLLDEPLSSIDPSFREEIRKILKKLHQQTQITFLMVTHDFTEALFLSDRAGVINQGRIEQVGSTTDIFQRPISPFVAHFVGMKNVFSANFTRKKAQLEHIEFKLNTIVPSSAKYLAVRPEDIYLSTESSEKTNTLCADVIEVAQNGMFYDIGVKTGNVIFQTIISKKTLFEKKVAEGARVFITIKPSEIHTF
jgi:molybdate/tungstate transport system ATP-binding protein